MIKISTVVQEQVEASPFLTEALQEGLINVSALARKMKGDIESRLGKEVKESAIIMAINRLHFGELLYIEKGLKQFFSKLSDISVRSNLIDYTYSNSGKLQERLTAVLSLIRLKYSNSFYSLSQGISETTIIVTNAIKEELEEILKEENQISCKERLSGISLMLPQENRQLYGIYYYILKELAWKGINLVELISTSNEFTIIVNNEDLNQAFSVLSELGKV